MYKRDGVFQTGNVSKGVNTCEYIVLHHTGVIGGGNLPILLGQRGSKVSAHFYINREGKAYKLSDPKKITRHAGKAERGSHKSMNLCSIGIEIEGNNETPFTRVQYEKALDVIRYLKQVLNVPTSNIIKHSDITRAGSKNMQLWDGKSKARKTDLAPRFWRENGFENFKLWRETNFR